MNIRFISPAVHSLLDYTAAIALIILPLVLDLSAESLLALWLSLGGGITLAIYSLLTDYELKDSKPIAYKYHLALDLVVAAVCIIAPIVFEWNLFTTCYYFLMGVGVLIVVGCSEKQELTTRELVGRLTH